MNSITMKKIALLSVVTLPALAGFGPAAFAKTHRDTFPVSCDVLWPAVKDAMRNSGKYGIVGIDITEMTVSYVIGDFKKRVRQSLAKQQQVAEKPAKLFPEQASNEK